MKQANPGKAAIAVTVFACALGRLTITNRLIVRTLLGRNCARFWASLSGNSLLHWSRRVIVFRKREIFLRKRKVRLRGLFGDAALQIQRSNRSGSHFRWD